jgi:adapter protein MecA 1/2
MKIEKISDNQIRCTLTQEDLETRGINLSELAYGSDKAKDLFHDMMYQASVDFGFDAEDAPLMIEAIPMNPQRIVLIITKVDNPDELDTRFSRFTSPDPSAASAPTEPAPPAENATDILELFEKARKALFGDAPLNSDSEMPKPPQQASDHISSAAAKKDEKDAVSVLTDLTRLYVFPNLSAVSKLANVIDGFYHGENTLYKGHKDGLYYLFIKKSAHSPQDFNKLCNIFSEYAQQLPITTSAEAFCEEYDEKLIDKNALQTLAAL